MSADDANGSVRSAVVMRCAVAKDVVRKLEVNGPLAPPAWRFWRFWSFWRWCESSQSSESGELL